MIKVATNNLWIKIFLSFFVTMFLVSSAFAEESWDPTDSELLALPPLCTAKINKDKEDDKYWIRTIGFDFIHMHHYCRGLALISRSYGKTIARERVETLGTAVKEFDYVLGHVNKDFVLLPEVYTNRASALKLLKKNGEAMQNLEEALRRDPKHVKAYGLLADLYVEQNDKEKALSLITEALRVKPGVKSLTRRYDDLGGKQPYPEPYQTTEQTSTNDAVSSQNEQLDAGLELESHAMPNKEQVDSGQLSNERDVPTESGQSTTQVNPKNPWCRFCPE